MALPKRYHEYIYPVVATRRYYIIFSRHDDLRDNCGYMGRTRTEVIRRCSLKRLDKFKHSPKHWDELEPFSRPDQPKLTGVDLS